MRSSPLFVTLRGVALVALALAAFTACGDDEPTSASEKACIPNQQAACACGAGKTGVQVCDANGAGYGECDCTGNSNPGSGGQTAMPNPSNGGVSTDEGSDGTAGVTTTPPGEGGNGGAGTSNPEGTPPPCRKDADCGPGGTCAKPYAGIDFGACAAPCPTGQCPGEEQCIMFEEEFLCVPECSAPADCGSAALDCVEFWLDCASSDPAGSVCAPVQWDAGGVPNYSYVQACDET